MADDKSPEKPKDQPAPARTNQPPNPEKATEELTSPADVEKRTEALKQDLKDNVRQDVVSKGREALAKMRQEVQARVDKAARENDPGKQALWNAALAHIAGAETVVETAEKVVETAEKNARLAGNATYQRLKNSGLIEKTAPLIGAIGTAGKKVAESLAIAYEFIVKPVWEKGIEPVYEKVRGMTHNMSSGMKSGLANMLRFMGFEGTAKWLEGSNVPVLTEAQKKHKEKLDMINGNLPTGWKMENIAEDVIDQVLAEFDDLRKELIQKEGYASLKTLYPDVKSYLSGVKSKLDLPANSTDKIAKIADIKAAAKKFNEDTASRDKDVKFVNDEKKLTTPPPPPTQPVAYWAPMPVVPPAAPAVPGTPAAAPAAPAAPPKPAP